MSQSACNNPYFLYKEKVPFEETLKKIFGVMKDNSEPPGINKKKEMSLDEFKTWIYKIDKSHKLDYEEIETIFQKADSDNKKKITLEKFYSFIQDAQGIVHKDTVLKSVIIEEKIIQPEPEPQPINVEKEKKKRVEIKNLSKEKEGKFAELMKNIEIMKADLFKIDENHDFKETVFNDQFACLKKCWLIVEDLRKVGKTYWEDPSFGPRADDQTGLKSILRNHGDNNKNGFSEREIEWARIGEICAPDAPEFLVEGATSSDVCKGALGNSWFVGALSVLASRDENIRGKFNPHEMGSNITDVEAMWMQRGVYPPMFHFLREYGIYVMRFFKNYKWRYVIIDDKLPVINKKEILFASCKDKKEFWVPLIEKAYAKIHQCYEALMSGSMEEALSDMSGFINTRVKLQTLVQSANSDPAALWYQIVDRLDHGAMMGCYIFDEKGGETELIIGNERKGLYTNRCYSIIQNFNLEKKKLKFLRIKNPWGALEWQGRYNDESNELILVKNDIIQFIQDKRKQQNNKEIEDYQVDAKDGTFLMVYEDFLNTWTHLCICYKLPDKWSGYRYFGAWIDQNAGGLPTEKSNFKRWAINPQYTFTVNRKDDRETSFIVILGQNDARLLNKGEYPFEDSIFASFFCILKLEKQETRISTFEKERMVHMSTLMNSRQLMNEFKLKNGKYVLVPSLEKPDLKTSYTLNIYFDCDKNEIEFHKKDFIVIEEEEEEAKEYSKLSIELLKIHADEVIFEA